MESDSLHQTRFRVKESREVRRSVKKGWRGRKKAEEGKKDRPSLKYSRELPPRKVRIDCAVKAAIRGGADWWLPEGLLILWKSAPSASYLKPSNLAPVSRGGGEEGRHTSSKFRVDIRLITRVSLPLHFRVRGGGGGCCRFGKSLSRSRSFGIFNLPDGILNDFA